MALKREKLPRVARRNNPNQPSEAMNDTHREYLLRTDANLPEGETLQVMEFGDAILVIKDAPDKVQQFLILSGDNRTFEYWEPTSNFGEIYSMLRRAYSGSGFRDIIRPHALPIESPKLAKYVKQDAFSSAVDRAFREPEQIDANVQTTTFMERLDTELAHVTFQEAQYPGRV